MEKIFFTDIVRVFVIFFCYIGALDSAYKMLCWLLEDKYIKFNIKK